ncbi:hypothetical protein [Embleya sp. AB8]|uniref:hypothetical protein n=1 Tax=Embleya sp. AB8 TaxID=3156304 RepID=UPI003C771C04
MVAYLRGVVSLSRRLVVFDRRTKSICAVKFPALAERMSTVSDKLIVDLPELEIFGRRLDAIRGALLGAPQRVEQARGFLGSGQLASALDYFEDNWKDGRHRMDQTLEALVTMSDQIVRGLEDTDQQLKTAIINSRATPVP